MRIGIIGPGQIEEYCKKSGISKRKYESIVRGLAGVVARSGNQIMVTPDKGSTKELFAQEYKNSGGKKVNVIVPLDDTEFGHKWVNIDIGDKQINCGTWRNQPESICENSDLFICIGWGGGTMAEMYYTRWMGKVKKIYVINETIDSVLPVSLEKGLGIIEYTPASKLESKLK